MAAVDFSRMEKIYSASAYSQAISKYFLLAKDGSPDVFSESKFIAGAIHNYGEIVRKESVMNVVAQLIENTADRAAEMKKIISLVHKSLLDSVLNERQFARLTIEVDMFSNRCSINIDIDRIATFVFKHVPYATGKINMAYVEDYRNHWPGFDEMLRFIIAARFAGARKKAYVWLKCPSDWGKGFFTGLLQDNKIKGVVELSVTELEKLFSGGPVGRTLADFKRAFLLVFNEAKGIKSEVKQLEQSISFAPKGLPTVFAPLYAKLFLSAESADSLGSKATGAEDQFVKRFSYIELEGNLHSRPVFQSDREGYRQSLVNYVAEELNRGFAEYVALGEKESKNAATRVVEEFHAKHTLGKTFANLNEKLPELSQQFVEWVLEKYREAELVTIKESRKLSVVENIVIENTTAGYTAADSKLRHAYCQGVGKMLKVWMAEEFGDAEGGKLKWKKSDFAKYYPDSQTHELASEGKKPSKRHKFGLIDTVEHLRSIEEAKQAKSAKQVAKISLEIAARNAAERAAKIAAQAVDDHINC